MVESVKIFDSLTICGYRVSVMKNELLEKLNSKYGNSEITRLANAGDLAGAQNIAAGMGMWGLWEQIGQAAGLPCDAAAREQWMAEFKTRRAAKFAKR